MTIQTTEKQALRAELDLLLSEDIDAARERERTAFDRVLASAPADLVLFGAGGLGRKTLAGLRQLGIEPLAFADNNAALWGKTVDGLQVLSPAEAAARFGDRAVFVITIWTGRGYDRMRDRRRQLAALNCPRVTTFVPLFWQHPETFLPHYAMDLPHKVLEQADAVRDTFALWSDDASRREYLAQLRWRLLGDFDALPNPVEHETYFSDDLFDLIPGEAFVDCGAFDGDTLRPYLERTATFTGPMAAFEPDPANFAALRAYADSLPAHLREKVSIYPYGVGAERGTVAFDASGTEASSVGSGMQTIEIVSLDETLTSPPTFIKMDIEGSELDAVVGAQNLIARHNPVLAVCVYHCQDHLWSVPQRIAQASDQYHFFLRPHLIEVWDLVCYAVPKGRLKANDGRNER